MKLKIKGLLMLLILMSGRVRSQDTLNYDALTLEDLMNIKVKVASITALPATESPGIITVISKEEIRNSGARDLMDVLESVPGFDFGMDVEGVVGLGIRGNWAHEGKVLLLIDGQVMNEGLYSTIQLGNHYPIQHIQRIEIIRGPGSAVYGDYAEYGVINIITETAADINGMQATASYGTLKESYANRGASLCVGKVAGSSSYVVNAGTHQSNRSDAVYEDVFGSKVDLTHMSKINNDFLNIGASYKQFSLRAIADLYRMTSVDEYQEVSNLATLHVFDSYFLELAHNWPVSSSVKINTRLNFKSQKPWAVDVPADSPHEEFVIYNNRYSFNSMAIWNPAEKINVTVGVESLYDKSYNAKDGQVFNSTGTSVLDYYNTSVYSQVMWKNKIAVFTAGARQNFHSNYNSSLVPRVGVTRTIGNFHFKALYSISYRAPGAENMDLGINIKPEETKVMELEAGYKFKDNLYVVVNAYDMQTRQPIIYYYNEITDQDAYINEDKTGTRGFETEIRFVKSWGQFRAGHSFYTANNMNVLESYSVPGNSESLLAFPNHKAYVSFSSSSNKRISVSTQGIISGERNYIGSVDESGEPVYNILKPAIKINLNIGCSRFLHKNISLRAGVYNLLDTKELYIQPYRSLHAPLPGAGREFRLELSYQWKRASN